MIGNTPYKEKKGHVANACVHCRMKKHGCDGERPCRRCEFEGAACMSSIRIDMRTTVLKTRDIIKQVQKLHNDARICTQLPTDTIEDGWTEERLLTLTAADREALNKHIKKIEEEIVQILTKRQKADTKVHEAGSSRKAPIAYTANVATPPDYKTTAHTWLKLENDLNPSVNNAQAYYPSKGLSRSPTAAFSLQSPALNSKYASQDKPWSPPASGSGDAYNVTLKDETPFTNYISHPSSLDFSMLGNSQLYVTGGLSERSNSGNAYQLPLLRDADTWCGCSGCSGSDQTPSSTESVFGADPSRSLASVNLNQTLYDLPSNGYRGGYNTSEFVSKISTPNNFAYHDFSDNVNSSINLPMPAGIANESGNKSSATDPFALLYQYYT